jgi:hypothetical protein
MMKCALGLALTFVACAATAETRSVFLEDIEGTRIQIASIEMGEGGSYSMVMNDDVFENHFLSMRPFKCLEGPVKNWCHVPYPYEIARNTSADLTDLEYDFLFVWKGSSEYGINMWNGVYYKIEQADGHLSGTLHEMDMDTLAVPPPVGDLRPVQAKHLHQSDPESHWLPRLVIE